MHAERPPRWVATLVAAARANGAPELGRFLATPGTGRLGAVLILLAGRSDDGSDATVVLTERAATLRAHAGQVAFPGGAADPGDADPVATAMREATEEIGLDPSTAQVLGTLPTLYLPVSDFAITPVLAWWRAPTPLAPVDVAEVARVDVVAVSELVDPARRFVARHPSGFAGPAFRAGGLYVWGFTAGLLTGVLRMAGLEQPWDQSHVEDLPAAVLEVS